MFSLLYFLLIVEILSRFFQNLFCEVFQIFEVYISVILF